MKSKGKKGNEKGIGENFICVPKYRQALEILRFQFQTTAMQ